MNSYRASSLGAACIAIALAAPAIADVKAGVDAWSRGDYDRAVAEWQAPAAAGDADAQFNLAQAYRLGRGVEPSEAQAEAYYAKAAAQGHLKAADNYGLLLFQDGRREAAMPYVTDAADRGDPRAQYLLGIAYFNGDLVGKDWVRAYALLTLANSAGLPQARPAIQQMDSFIPLAQRQQAQSLATQIKQKADAERTTRLAAADLGVDQPQVRSAPPQVAVAPPVRQPLPSAATRIPEPIPDAVVPPSVAAAEVAVAEARRVTGTQSPAQAGADYAASTGASPQWTAGPSASASALPGAAAAQPVTRPARVSGAIAAPAAIPAPDPAPAPAPAATQAMSGSWKVQLGAFGVAGNAERLWARLSARPELAGAQKLAIPTGNVTRLLAGGYPSRNAAQDACNALKRAGQDCLVTQK